MTRTEELEELVQETNEALKAFRQGEGNAKNTLRLISRKLEAASKLSEQILDLEFATKTAEEQ